MKATVTNLAMIAIFGVLMAVLAFKPHGLLKGGKIMSKTEKIKKAQKVMLSVGLVIVAILFLAPAFLDSFLIFLLTRILFMGLAAMSLFCPDGVGKYAVFCADGILWNNSVRNWDYNYEAGLVIWSRSCLWPFF